jgi:CRP-like cAMP-binding protein
MGGWRSGRMALVDPGPDLAAGANGAHGQSQRRRGAGSAARLRTAAAYRPGPAHLRRQFVTMPLMAEEVLDRILREIRERKREARAAYEELQRLECALAALDESARGGDPRRSKQRRSGRARSRGRAGKHARRGANRELILVAVRERPGSTAREIADATGIARATVASTLTRLASNGTLARRELDGGGVGFRVT